MGDSELITFLNTEFPLLPEIAEEDSFEDYMIKVTGKPDFEHLIKTLEELQAVDPDTEKLKTFDPRTYEFIVYITNLEENYADYPPREIWKEHCLYGRELMRKLEDPIWVKSLIDHCTTD